MFFRKRAEPTNFTVIAPWVVTPTADFLGNDGRWSTFLINVGDDATGTKGQDFKVLISTSSSITTVPEQANWCDTPDEEACAANRGVQLFQNRQSLGFQSSLSSSWKTSGLFDLPVLSYSDNFPEDSKPKAEYGLDNVGLGPSSTDSLIMADQVVAGISTQNFFMGSFGLGIQPIDNGGVKQPWLYNFHHFNNTPSKAYGYQAGAYYQNDNKSVPASLIIGGFDLSRFNAQKGTSISMPSNRTLLVGVQSIEYVPDQSVDPTKSSFTADTSGFPATIDSTLPYLWLPREVCDEFEEKFRLKFDEDAQLYTINDAAHRFNLEQKATVSFKIGQSVASSNEYTSIVLPYAAFDLEASQPLVNNVTKYFPIKRSVNGQYVLGRAFLQETYLIVDYERSNFTVAPAHYADPMPAPTIIPIWTTDYKPPGSGSKSGGGGLAPGAIAGIAVGVVIGVLLLLLAAFFLWKKKRGAGKPVETIPKPTEIDVSLLQDRGEQKHYPGFHHPYGAHNGLPEMESNAPTSPRMSENGTFYGDERDRKDWTGLRGINEMESPNEVAELESPPPVDGPFAQTMAVGGYFQEGPDLKRSGARRESGNGGQNGGAERPPHTRSTSDTTTVTNNLDTIVADSLAAPNPSSSISNPPSSRVSTSDDETRDANGNGDAEGELGTVDEGSETLNSNAATHGSAGSPTTTTTPTVPIHVRGPSETTVQSAVSEPTAEEREEWGRRPSQQDYRLSS